VVNVGLGPRLGPALPQFAVRGGAGSKGGLFLASTPGPGLATTSMAGLASRSPRRPGPGRVYLIIPALLRLGTSSFTQVVPKGGRRRPGHCGQLQRHRTSWLRLAAGRAWPRNAGSVDASDGQIPGVAALLRPGGLLGAGLLIVAGRLAVGSGFAQPGPWSPRDTTTPVLAGVHGAALPLGPACGACRGRGLAARFLDLPGRPRGPQSLVFWVITGGYIMGA